MSMSGVGDRRFRVGITDDFLDGQGEIAYDELHTGLDLLARAGIDHDFVPAAAGEVAPEAVAGYDRLLVLTPTVSRRTIEGADRLLVVARWGVGYDNVDVDACTDHGIAVTITPEACDGRSPTPLVNVARGPVVDGPALVDALREGRIRGAGIDVFEQEPPDPADPLLRLDNVILSPHGLCWTDECFSGIARQACQSLVDVAGGRVPEALVNRSVLDRPRFRSRLQANAEQGAAR